MAISVVATAISSEKVGGTTIDAFSIDLGTGTDRGVFVGIAFTNNAGTGVTSVTVGGQAMTEIWDFRDSALDHWGCSGYIWTGSSLTGSQSVVVTMSTTIDIAMAGAVAFNGIHQTTASAYRTPHDSATQVTTLPAKPTVVADNAVSGDLIIGVIAVSGASVAADFTHQTELQTTDNINLGIQTTAGTGSNISLTWTPDSGEQIATLGSVALVQSVSTTTVTPGVGSELHTGRALGMDFGIGMPDVA